MTQDKAPTGAEIESLGHRMCWRYKHDTGVDHISTFTFNAQTLKDFTREAIKKWGQPARSGEPVAWKNDCAALLTNDVELWIDACPHCGKPRNAPQPVERTSPWAGLMPSNGHITSPGKGLF